MRDEGVGQVREVHGVADSAGVALPRCSPGGRKTTENLPKVTGLRRESNPDLPNERCVG